MRQVNCDPKASFLTTSQRVLTMRESWHERLYYGWRPLNPDKSESPSPLELAIMAIIVVACFIHWLWSQFTSP